MHIGRWLQTIPLRVRSVFDRTAVEHELDEELQYHIEQQVAQNISRGMSAADARRAARVALGGVERRKDESRDTRRVHVFEHLVRDVRHGVRMLRRSRGYTFVAVVTLALGIGANTAIFSVVHGILLAPLGYAEPERLVTVAYGRGSTVAAGVFLDWKAASRSFSGMGLEEYWTPNQTRSDKPEQLTGVRISGEILPLLGVRPLLGRIFEPAEVHAGRSQVLVIGYDFWKNRLQGDSAVLGRTLTLDGEPYTIVGVMPQGFKFTPYWATTAMFAAPLVLDSRGDDRSGASLRSFARLAPGVTLEQARAEMRGIAARLERQYPGTNQNVTVTPLREEVVASVEPALLILLGAVAFVLLIACANVAHLQLVRAAARNREFGLRAALGASRSRIIQQSLVESGLLALAGGAIGLILAAQGVRLLVLIAPPTIPRLGEIQMSAGVFGFALVATVLASLVFGLAPALRVARLPANDVLKEGGRSSGESRRQRQARGTLVVSEFALALVLLVGAGLVTRSFVALLGVDPGFETSSLISMQVSVRGTRHAPLVERERFFRDLVDRASMLPGVRSASAINHVPLAGDDWHFPFAVEGGQVSRPGAGPRAAFLVVHPGYFHTMGIPMARGREFLPEDISAATHAVVISESLARRYWPDADPIGKRLSVDDPVTHPDWFTIIGVANDVRQGSWTETNREQMYFPYIQDSRRPERAMSLASFLQPEYMTLVVRTAGDPDALTRAVDALVRDMDPDAPVSFPITMENAVARQLATPRFYLFLLGSFAAIALALAAVGVYGVISYSVSRRAHEIGVRVALGAARKQIIGMVVGEGIRLATMGAAIGVLAAVALTRYLGTLLYGVEPTDPMTFGIVAVVLGGIALAACWIPTRAALRVSPADALRSE